MQSLARGFLDRQRVLLRRKEYAAEQLLFQAASAIQARWRGVMARTRIRQVTHLTQNNNSSHTKQFRVWALRFCFSLSPSLSLSLPLSLSFSRSQSWFLTFIKPFWFSDFINAFWF